MVTALAASRGAQAVAAKASRRFPSRARSFAEPPRGSGLKPVRGSFGVPGVGYAFEMLHDQMGFLRSHSERFGPVAWIGGPGMRAVSVVGADGIGEVLMNRDKAFSSAEGWGKLIGEFFGGGLMLMDFEEHRRHRLIMQEAFARDRLVGYLEVANPTIQQGMAQWQADESFRIYDHLKKLTLNIGTKVFVGAELGEESDRLEQSFVDLVSAGQAIVRADVPGGKWHRGVVGRRHLQDYFREQLPAKRAGDGADLFSVLCRARTEDGDQFTDEEIVNHMIFVLMAAHDTTTITVANMVYYLAKSPEWQERLRAESRAVGKATVTFDDLPQLPSMDLVMKEALRMSAPVSLLVRKAVKDTEIEGHHIPAGTMVFAGISPMQRMSPWTDPDVFDPERFSDERREDRENKFMWSPFGAGAHKCIGLHFGGMEAKAILHQLLLSYSWSVPDRYEPPLVVGTGPIPGDGLPVKLVSLDLSGAVDPDQCVKCARHIGPCVECEGTGVVGDEVCEVCDGAERGCPIHHAEWRTK